ncbi:eIF-2-alpha kinase GCN2 [Geodia barretti]|uniref:EIF-2-alpha kinase GCN2 n=2 Tax=Geodia barretti TaxID=519541 RepID=A0AA35TPA3_GEOBA|nr:eIF-2-alpha kinase GCN2 [Geodia barretti]
MAGQAWQEIQSVVSLFRLLGGKEQVLLHPALSPAYHHYSGVVFSVFQTTGEVHRGQRRHRSRVIPVAIGGRYDRLLSGLKSCGDGVSPGMGVVGVGVVGEEIMRGVTSEYQHGRCPVTKSSVLVCWLGHESLQAQCLKLVTQLWSHGVAADLVYENQELDSLEDIQEFCRRSLIPHIVVLSDKELFFERKQVRLRSLEVNGKTSERVLGVAELPEFLLQQRHSTDRSDSVETQTTTRSGGGPSGSDSFPSNARPPVCVTVLSTSKLSGHNKRKIHDATLTKLLPLLETFPSKQPLEILVVGVYSG